MGGKWLEKELCRFRETKSLSISRLMGMGLDMLCGWLNYSGRSRFDRISGSIQIYVEYVGVLCKHCNRLFLSMVRQVRSAANNKKLNRFQVTGDE